jgi:hypothetical protein
MIPHGFEPRCVDSESLAPIVIGHHHAGYLLALNLASSVQLDRPLALDQRAPDATTQQVAVLAAR